MPSRYSDELAEIASQAIQRLGIRNQAREQALPASREVIRFSANAIRAVHRGEFEEARQLLDRAGQRLKDTDPIREDTPEIYYAGFMTDARKEYTEAHVTLAVLSAIGEYVMRSFLMAQKYPAYVVREIHPHPAEQ